MLACFDTLISMCIIYPRWCVWVLSVITLFWQQSAWKRRPETCWEIDNWSTTQLRKWHGVFWSQARLKTQVANDCFVKIALILYYVCVVYIHVTDPPSRVTTCVQWSLKLMMGWKEASLYHFLERIHVWRMFSNNDISKQSPRACHTQRPSPGFTSLNRVLQQNPMRFPVRAEVCRLWSLWGCLGFLWLLFCLRVETQQWNNKSSHYTPKQSVHDVKCCQLLAPSVQNFHMKVHKPFWL